MVLVAIERKGCFHFNLTGGRSIPLNPAYVGEKLSLAGTDAECMTALLNFTREAFLARSLTKEA